ncbi:uncharacterized protein LOC133795363 [Humulus lupulus]|uniref:uncharacterized protein LOC133795363 n=1 Tax=Humulus lupulus TaxID=3486 RepID=UPI002B409FC8|nr:uncharacterized protein LOC133795363 [Humulus lupulus]
MYSIHSIKSPGPDGNGAGFFKAMWKDIGKEISMAVLDFFETDLIKGYNRKNSCPRCAMKIDLSKAYDTIDWGFLEDLLNALCFPSRFIKWVMVCLRGTTYSLMMNGRIQGQFKGEKWLRQGDPISPLLLVIVMDYLTRLLLKASTDKNIKFHPMCKYLNLIIICFADNLILFCKGNIGSVQIIQGMFDAFCAASGLAINKNKSHIFFAGLKVTEKIKILLCTKIDKGSFLLKYLGVPMWPTKWKATDCDLIIKKIRLRLHSWSIRHLSFAGQVQLIHSVLLGLRSYWMSIFLLPQSVAKDIDRPRRNFLWGERWSRICAQVDESQAHLFFDCPFSKRIMQRVYGWLGAVIWPESYAGWLAWIA